MGQQPSQMVRVHLDADYYQGEFFREDRDGAYEIPREQLDRWKAAENAYRTMQDEIGALLEKNRTDRATEK